MLDDAPVARVHFSLAVDVTDLDTEEPIVDPAEPTVNVFVTGRVVDQRVESL